jgi:hypothetical protein
MGLSRFTLSGATALILRSVGAAVPAAAEDLVAAKHGTAYVDTVDGVLYEECFAHTYSYGITLAPNTASWSMVVAVDDPSGVVATDVFSSGENPPLSGTRTVELCGDTDKAGPFTLRARLIDRVGFYQEMTDLTPDAFTMRKHHAQAVHHHRAEGVEAPPQGRSPGAPSDHEHGRAPGGLPPAHDLACLPGTQTGREVGQGPR